MESIEENYQRAIVELANTKKVQFPKPPSYDDYERMDTEREKNGGLLLEREQRKRCETKAVEE